MNTLDRYIGKNLLISSLFAVAIIIIIIVLGNVFQEILKKLNKYPEIDILFVLKFIALVIPFSLGIAVPFSFLTAILLTFGRLSADSEFIAMRMAGLSMVRICVPVALLTILFTGICGWVNLSVTPAAKLELEGMKGTLINMVKRNPMALFPDQKVMTELPGRLLWAKKDGEILRNFQMIKLKGYLPEALVLAENARVSVDLQNEVPQVMMNMDRVNLLVEGEAKDFMKESQPLYVRKAVTGVPVNKLKVDKESKADEPENIALFRLIGKANDHTLDEKMRSTYRTELSMRMAFSVSCVAFALIGVPLGVTSQRRESTTGFVISLGIAVSYYVILNMIQMVREKEELYPYLLVWAPNIIVVGLGIWLFRRLNQK